jgi:rhodanese-related sulfurtransferase
MLKNTNMQTIQEIPALSCEDLFENLGDLQIIDVRHEREFYGRLGHISGARLITLGPGLSEFLTHGDRFSPLVFVCRSGWRARRATQESIEMGYRASFMLTGGMQKWIEKALPRETL